MSILGDLAGWATVAAILCALIGIYLLAGAGLARLYAIAIRNHRALPRRVAWVIVTAWPLTLAAFVAAFWIWVIIGALLELGQGARRFLRWIGRVATGA